MTRLLIVEDQSQDLLAAVQVARSAGFEYVDARQSVPAARELLQRGLQRKVPLPDVLILDLDLGSDSGFELIRFCRKSRLGRIPTIVWSVFDDKRGICRMLGIDAFVSKSDGPAGLREALGSLSAS